MKPQDQSGIWSRQYQTGLEVKRRDANLPAEFQEYVDRLSVAVEEVERPIGEPRFADDLVDLDEPKRARVRTVVAIVAQHVDIAGGNRPKIAIRSAWTCLVQTLAP